MNKPSEFVCLALTPIELPNPGIALAAARAGGIGILDVQFCPDSAIAMAQTNLKQLLHLTTDEQSVGLRLSLAHTTSLRAELLELLAGRPHWLILCDWNTDSLRACLDDLPQANTRHLLLEVTDADQLSALQAISTSLAGVVAKGQESGGWVGEDAAFILAQKLLRNANVPVYVQGGIGIHTASACRAVGASGVILDDGLWLMPESPLRPELQKHLQVSEGQNTVVIGGDGAAALRTLQRPGFGAVKELQELNTKLKTEADYPVRWQRQVAKSVGWGDPDKWAWPVGQGIGQAVGLRKRFKTTGRYIQALQDQSRDIVRLARRLRCLRPDGPLAVSHGSRYPIVQGPMTRVSDTEQFSAAVARAGGLPMLALALMPGRAVEQLLEKTKTLLGESPWGVGILGFVPLELRRAQLEAVIRIKPSFALIAGGRPDQALQLEREGIPTYLHVPTPGLAKTFIDQGARRFIFEGRECGGHVGPLSSFALWESTVSTLLEVVPDNLASQVHVIFAGGIHDALSATMVETLAAPLAERGIKVGVLMGTAYLFTQEAVDLGAIVKGFQQQAVECVHTVNLETGPGHASRCAVTPFTHEFSQTASKLKASGKSVSEISSALDDLCLGRLRIAAKGLTRHGSKIVGVDAAAQLTDGMYMIGQVGTMRSDVISIEQLHRSVSEDTAYAVPESLTRDRTVESAGSAYDPTQLQRRCDVAIIGIGTILPKANSTQEFWKHILNKVDAVAEVPPERWDWHLYYDSNPKVRDKTYSKWGCFLDEVTFDPTQFGIPPVSLRSIDPLQLLALEAVRRALVDADYANGDFDRENTSVILGCSGGLGELGERYVARTELTGRFDDSSDDALEGLPEWTEDSFPGILPNVAAGRVANRFDLGGANFTVDSACASSLTAIDLAISQLETGRCNVAIAGGVDTKLSPFGYLCFSKTPALTPQQHSSPFDSSADGILLGEGVAVVILKRLEDAERDGDNIYAVLKAAASSSDGKALGLTAPRSSGQLKALDRAYTKAGIGPETIGLYEAHGTGTKLGDETEVGTITQLLVDNQAEPNSCAVGSVKALIGHTKSTAGIAALIKTALALHYRTIPPQPYVQTPLEKLHDPKSPVYLQQEATPWLGLHDYPRRAGVSAFGFGGTNCHCVLEEYHKQLHQVAPGGEEWPAELVLLTAADRTSLVHEVAQLRDSLADAAAPVLRDIAYSCALRAQSGSADLRLALIVENTQKLIEALSFIRDYLQDDSQSTPLPPHIRLSSPAENEQDQGPGKIAFLFPGQGAQYLDMAREAALFLDPMRESLVSSDRVMQGRLPKHLSQYIYPPGRYSPSEQTEATQQLTSTAVAQPAIGAIEMGYLSLLSQLGLKPDVVGGHSYGEYTALHAAGVLSDDGFLQLSRIRGQTMAEASANADGAMAAVNAPRQQVEELLLGTSVVLANHNAPLQTVIAGEKDAVERLISQLKEQGIKATLLPVSGAFHSELMRGSQSQLAQAIASAEIELPRVPVISNVTGEAYAADAEALRSQLSGHLLSPVEFVKQITTMYGLGVRCFVEVGPKSILTGFVGQILEQQPHLAVSVDGNGGGLRGLLIALGALYCHGLSLEDAALFANRGCHKISVPVLPPAPAQTTSSAQWLVSGGRVRKAGEAVTASTRRFRLTESVESNAAVSKIPLVSNKDDMTMSKPNDYTRQATGSDSAAFDAPAELEVPSEPTKASAASAAYQAYQETMREFLSMQERVMQQFLAGSPPTIANTTKPGQAVSEPRREEVHEPHSPSQAPSKPAQVVPQDVEPSVRAEYDETLDRKQVVETLLDIVSESTGYPPEMLGLDQDLEAELGIDSIKRVEILAAVEKAVPSQLSAVMSAHMEDFTQVKTLNGLADSLLKLLQMVPDLAPDPAQPASEESPQQITAKPAVSSGEISQDQLTRKLVDVVSECTGYPPEMLGLDQDLEAELGIDSIKRVEILAAVEKAVPSQLSAVMSAHMEDFTQVKTLNGLADSLLKLLQMVPDLAPDPAQPASEESPQQITAKPAVSSGEISQDQLTRKLVEVVSESTGYPPEMLGLDQDLEAELGIDSIKRVEILAAVEKAVPSQLSAVMSAHMEDFTQVKTLNGLADSLLKLLQMVPDLAPDPAEPASEVSAAKVMAMDGAASGDREGPRRTDRYVMRSKPAPLAKMTPIAVEGFVLITEDELSIAGLLKQQLQAGGIAAAVLQRSLLQSPELLSNELESLREKHGKVAGLVHLAGLCRQSLPDDIAAWHEVTEVQSKGLFLVTQACGEDLRQTHGQIVAASMLGGHFGRNGSCGPGLPSSGSNSGFLKTIAIEWPEVRIRAVDFADAAEDEIAAALLNEFYTDDEETEIGYEDGQRSVFYAVKEPLNTQTPDLVQPDGNWVVLAVGGARGITAEVIQELVVPGMTLVLVGRSDISDSEDPLTQGIDDIGVLREFFIEKARNAGDAITPVQIERQVNKLQRERNIRANLATLVASGAIVEYHAVDVTDAELFVALIDDTYDRFGRIDAVIQGAGVIEDKLVMNKTRVSFDRVFDTKIDSTYLLCRHLRPESLKLVLFFASIAGRTGNRGQADYAAANEVLNRFAWWMHEQWRDTRVISINWGPWDVMGMASEAVNRQFRERGVIPILPEMGRSFVRDELKYGDRNEVEIVSGIFKAPGQASDVQAKEFGPREVSAVPMLSEPPQVKADGTVTLNYTFSLRSSRYLDHHRLDGTPVVPAAGALELLAEFVQCAWPDRVVTEIRDLRVLCGLVLDGDADTEVLLRASPATLADDEMVEVNAEIIAPESQRCYYRASVVLRPESLQPDMSTVEPLASERTLGVEGIYGEHCFHGPRFQMLTAVTGVNEQGVDSEAIPSRPSDWMSGFSEPGRWIFDPGIVDAALQNIIVWSRMHLGTYPLPSRFGRITVFGGIPADARLRITTRIISYDDKTLFFNFWVVDEHGRVLMELGDIEGAHSKALNRLAPSAGKIKAKVV